MRALLEIAMYNGHEQKRELYMPFRRLTFSSVARNFSLLYRVPFMWRRKLPVSRFDRFAQPSYRE